MSSTLNINIKSLPTYMTYINAANDLTSQEHIGLPAASVHSLKRGAPCCVGQGLLRKSF